MEAKMIAGHRCCRNRTMNIGMTTNVTMIALPLTITLCFIIQQRIISVHDQVSLLTRCIRHWRGILDVCLMLASLWEIQRILCTLFLSWRASSLWVRLHLVIVIVRQGILESLRRNLVVVPVVCSGNKLAAALIYLLPLDFLWIYSCAFYQSKHSYILAVGHYLDTKQCSFYF